MKISVKSANYEMIYELNNSKAAKALYAQLPLTMEVKPFSSNEMTFYPTQDVYKRQEEHECWDRIFSVCFSFRKKCGGRGCGKWDL